MSLLFTVVIPTFNRRTMLQAAVESVDAQTFRDFEIVIADDGSNDGTLDWLAACRPDIRVVNSAGKGAGGARNAGIAAAKGDYISLLDSDDLWHPQVLAHVATVLGQYPDSALVLLSEFRFQDDDGFQGFSELSDIRTEIFPTLLDAACHCKGFTGTAVWGALKRETFEEAGSFREDRTVNMEDLDWLFLAGEHGPVVRIASPPLVGYRLHGMQITKDPMQFYRSVELFLKRESRGEYPSKDEARRRNRIAEMVCLPLSSLHGIGNLGKGASLIRKSAEVLGWRITASHFPRMLKCMVKSLIK